MCSADNEGHGPNETIQNPAVQMDLMEELAEEVAMYVDAHWAPEEYGHLFETFRKLKAFVVYQKERDRPLPHFVERVIGYYDSQLN
jgi:hypothetical protein